jgi:polar amino acid transport system ATP-binding protein
MVEEVESVIRRLVNSGMTCVIVTHEMRFARNIASQVVFLAEKGIYESGTSQEVFDNPSRSLTRQFLYRARMLERNLTGADADVYSLSSEIRAFAAPYGFGLRPSKALDYICDELLLPILRSNPHEMIQFRFIADENGLDHTALISFPGLDVDPLRHPAIDELNLKLLHGFTREMESRYNGDGVREVKILL